MSGIITNTATKSFKKIFAKIATENNIELIDAHTFKTEGYAAYRLKKIYPKYSDKILLTEIQVENNDDYTNEQIKKYGISLVPTTIFIDKDGNKVDKIEGDIEAQELEEMMKELINE